MSDRFISFHVKDQSPEAAPGCGCDLFADPGQGVVPLEEMLAAAGNPRNRRYTVERHSQVHPLTSAKIGYDFCAASASNKAELTKPTAGAGSSLLPAASRRPPGLLGVQ